MPYLATETQQRLLKLFLILCVKKYLMILKLKEE
jgi:hypothetical protein